MSSLASLQFGTQKSKKKKKKKCKTKSRKVDAMMSRWLTPDPVEGKVSAESTINSLTPSLAQVPNQVTVPSDFDQQVQRQLNKLTETSANVRKAALAEIDSLFNSFIASTQELVDEPDSDDEDEAEALPADEKKMVAVCFSECLKPLLKRFADPVEKCRDISLRIVIKNLSLLTNIFSWLPYILPVISFRMNSESASYEPSEEIRMLMLQLLRAVMERSELNEKQDECLPFLSDICSVLNSAVADKAPQVKVDACQCIPIICDLHPEPMRGVSQILFQSFVHTLIHKRAKVRIAGLQAIHKLVNCGASEQIRTLAAFREANIIDIHGFYHGETRVNYFAHLVADGNVKVRTKFYEIMCDWMTNLPERFDYETLMMPYLLSGFSDTSEHIIIMTYQCVKKMGANHEKWNEEQMKDELFFLAEAEEKLHAHMSGLKRILPHPFTERPTLGARIVGRKFLDRLINAICNEFNDWKDQVAYRSCTLLSILLVYAEGHINQYTQQLIFTFQRIALRQNVAEKAQLCMRLVGRYAKPEAIIPMIIRGLEERTRTDMDLPLNTAIVLRHILNGAPPSLYPEYLHQLIELFCQVEIRSSTDPAFVAAICRIILEMIKMDLSLHDRQELVYPLFTLILSFRGWAVEWKKLYGPRKDILFALLTIEQCLDALSVLHDMIRGDADNRIIQDKNKSEQALSEIYQRNVNSDLEEKENSVDIGQEEEKLEMDISQLRISLFERLGPIILKHLMDSNSHQFGLAGDSTLWSDEGPELCLLAALSGHEDFLARSCSPPAQSPSTSQYGLLTTSKGLTALAQVLSSCVQKNEIILVQRNAVSILLRALDLLQLPYPTEWETSPSLSFMDSIWTPGSSFLIPSLRELSQSYEYFSQFKLGPVRKAIQEQKGKKESSSSSSSSSILWSLDEETQNSQALSSADTLYSQLIACLQKLVQWNKLQNVVFKLVSDQSLEQIITLLNQISQQRSDISSEIAAIEEFRLSRRQEYQAKCKLLESKQSALTLSKPTRTPYTSMSSTADTSSSPSSLSLYKHDSLPEASVTSSLLEQLFHIQVHGQAP